MNFSHENLPVLRQQLALDFNISTTGNAETLLQELAARVNDLVQHDFAKLVGILYRIDIPENIVATALKQQAGADAGVVIAQLIIERQIQKQKIREQFKPPGDIADDEKW